MQCKTKGMIEYIKGELTEIEPTTAVIEAGGVGYLLNITLSDYGRLRQHAGQQLKLFVEEVIREDAHSLYGFMRRDERAMFRILVGVSGVGPGTARLILGEYDAAELQMIIAQNNDKALKAVKGIGVRTAQRIIVDLSNKIKDLPATFISEGASESTFDEALGALTTLGFASAAAQKVLQKLYREEPSLSTEEAIRRALKLF